MKFTWKQGASAYYQYAAEDPRYTCVKWCAAGNGDGKDKYWAAYRPSTHSPVENLSGFTTDLTVARKAAEAHYGRLQRIAA